MVEIKNLTKDFQGTTAVRDLSFSAASGEIFGLLGPNGAGKTTTIRVLATVLKPTSGTAVINGHDVVRESEAARADIGVLTAEAGLYDRFTARENIRYFGRLYGLEGEALEKRINDLIGLLEMERFADRPAGKFSTGMKQKVAIARSVVHDPPVVIFDEPTAGLDVLAAQTVIRMMKTFRQHGKLVILSTHEMHNAERLCDRVAIIHRGRLVTMGAVSDVKAKADAASLEEAFLNLIGDDEAHATLLDEEAKSMAAATAKKKTLWRR